MSSVRLRQGYFLINNLPPRVSLRFKGLFPRVPKHLAGSFRLKASPEICTDLLWFIERYPLDVDPEAHEALIEGRRLDEETARAASSILSETWKPSGAVARFKPDMRPYPYQEQAAALAARLGRLLLMDDVGLGKTVSALASLIKADAFPAAIVVQAHLAEQWRDEYVAEFTELACHVIKGTKPYDLPEADIYLFKYTNIAGWTDIAGTGFFKAVVFDEIQELRRGEKAQKGKAALEFVANVDMRLGLTATPIYNYGGEIFNVVELLVPGELGSLAEFHLEWCTLSGDHALLNDPASFGQYLLDRKIALRRTEVDVERQIPPVNTLLMHVDYEEAEIARIEDEAKVLALKVISGSFAERGQAARELDMMARLATGRAKAKSVATMVRMLAESGEKVLLAGWHRDVYEIWLKELKDLSPVMYTGSESPKQKVAAKQAFIEGDARVMIISLRSGAGLDGLQRVSNTVVIGELDWSPQVHKQLIGRLRRPGQERQVNAIYVHTNGGSDPVLVELLGLKSSQAQGVVDPLGATPSERHSDDSRIRQLAKQFLEKQEEQAA